MDKQSAFLLISNLQNDADVHWICGAEPPEAAVLLKNGRKLTLLVPAMEKARLQHTVKLGIRVLCPADLDINPGRKISEWVLALLKENNLKTVSVPFAFPFGIVEALRKKGIFLKLFEKAFCPRREIKNSQEICAVQKSQRAAVAAMKAAIGQIAAAFIAENGQLKIGKNTLTAETVRATINRTLIDHDCIAKETIVACGSLSADPHERGSGLLVAGRPIVIDIFPRSGKTGYWGDITRTVCRGPAPVALKKQYAAVKTAQTAQLKMLKAGVRADSVHKAGEQLMAARGFKTETVDGNVRGFIHGTGHGVGLEIHETPRISSANRETLKVGHIITIEPGLYYPEIGGVRIEDTVAITLNGYTMLSPCTKKLEI